MIHIVSFVEFLIKWNNPIESVGRNLEHLRSICVSIWLVIVLTKARELLGGTFETINEG